MLQLQQMQQQFERQNWQQQLDYSSISSSSISSSCVRSSGRARSRGGLVVAAVSKASFEAAAAITTLEPHNPARAVDDSATRVGLDNPKAVCHLNALLQCLFMDVEFSACSWTLSSAGASMATPTERW